MPGAAGEDRVDREHRTGEGLGQRKQGRIRRGGALEPTSTTLPDKGFRKSGSSATFHARGGLEPWRKEDGSRRNGLAQSPSFSPTPLDPPSWKLYARPRRSLRVSEKNPRLGDSHAALLDGHFFHGVASFLRVLLTEDAPWGCVGLSLRFGPSTFSSPMSSLEKTICSLGENGAGGTDGARPR